MVLALLRWLRKNLGSLILAFVMALAVWVSAVIAEDPNVERYFPGSVPLEVLGPDPGLLLMDEMPERVSVKLRTPRSVWERLTSEEGAVRAVVDLSGLSPGTHQVPVQLLITLQPVRVVDVSPDSIPLTLEALVSRAIPIHTVVIGEPALGYEVEDPVWDSLQVTVSGPQSFVEQVDEVRATLDISGARESISVSIPLEVLDENDQAVTGVQIDPEAVLVDLAVQQAGGYRDVAVKLVTEGQVANGYYVTNISVSPPVVTLFSADPQRVNELPGFIETFPLDLTDGTDDIEARLGLDLPEGITVVGGGSVLVQVSIAAIRTSRPVSLPVDVVGLAPGLEARVSPENVDVILSGPLPELDAMQPEDVRVFVDLTGLDVGIHQVTPADEILLDQVRVKSILPETLEVEIVVAPTLSPTLSVTSDLTATGTPSPTATLTPTLTATATFTPTSTPTPTVTGTPTP